MDIRDFQQRCQLLTSEQYVRDVASEWGSDFCDILEDPSGDDALRAGLSLFGYLSDLIVENMDKGMEAWSVIFAGYPGIPHSDIILPFHDVLSTRQLWFHASHHLMAPRLAKGRITINLYLRWYIAAVELSQKLLTYAVYCRGIATGHEVQVRRYLFEGSSPIKTLKGTGVPGREVLYDLYDPKLRHTIAHGNIFVLPSEGLVVVRQSDDDKEKMVQTEYSLNDEDTLVKHLQADVEPMYQGARVFFTLLSRAVEGATDLLDPYLREAYSSEAMNLVVRAVKEDPDGSAAWGPDGTD